MSCKGLTRIIEVHLLALHKTTPKTTQCANYICPEPLLSLAWAHLG